jgi:hypothetical protein
MGSSRGSTANQQSIGALSDVHIRDACAFMPALMLNSQFVHDAFDESACVRPVVK